MTPAIVENARSCTSLVSGVPKLRRRLSGQLARLAVGFSGRPVRMGEVIDALQHRGNHAVLLLLAAPFILPVPLPGFSTVFGFVIVFFGLASMVSRPARIPESMRGRVLTGRVIPKVLLAASRACGRMEKWLRPRMLFPEHPQPFQWASGAIITVCGVLLMLPLPVPFSNAFPALTILLLAAAGLERDGAMFVAGCVQFLLCLGFFALLLLGGWEAWARWLA